VTPQETHTPCHVSFLVSDLAQARRFYSEQLGFTVRRDRPTTLHLDCFGHQIVVHESSGYSASTTQRTVEGDEFVVPHWGIILDKSAWEAMCDVVRDNNIPYARPPHRRFVGTAYEQRVFFLLDPSGNAIEFKHYMDRPPESWC
jgi:extradiol dioxygenase family protein